MIAPVLCEGHEQWMITYDANERVIEDLYPAQRSGWFSIAPTAGRQHVGQE